MSRLVRKPTLVDQVTTILEDRILEGFYPPRVKLPVEEELVREFETSRTTIRSSVDRLISKGLVFRRHGVGTFVAGAPKIKNPLDSFIDFQELIKRNDKTPGCVIFQHREFSPDESLREKLQLDVHQKVLEIDKYWTADGVPVVFCRNYTPLWIFRDSLAPDDTAIKRYSEPILDFYRRFCHQRLVNYIAAIRSGTVGATDVDILKSYYVKTVSLLIIDQIGFNSDGVPVHHSLEFHPDNLMKFCFNRKVQES